MNGTQMLISKLNRISLSVKQAKQVHALILVHGDYNLEPILVHQLLLSASHYSATVTQYVNSILHNSMSPESSFSWGLAIRFCTQHGRFKEAFALYVKMQRRGLPPTTFALSSALKACARLVYKLGGFCIHGQVQKFGFSGAGDGVYVETALMDLYCKLGDMKIARKMFDEMAERNVVSWNSMLAGYLKSGDLVVAQRVFDEIPKKDVISWNSMISGYARAGDMEKASLLFQLMPERNLASWNAMISGYVEFRDIKTARSFFDAMPQRNNVSWVTMISGYSKCGDVDSASYLFDQVHAKDLLLFNAMIACFAQNNRPKEALNLFNTMHNPNVNIQPDEMTMASVISACSQLGDGRFGPWIESFMRRHGIEMDGHLATALLDLYAKCGSIDKAYELFHGLRKKDLVAYTAMILGCGINGKAADAIKLFDEMIDAQLCPNSITFIGLLTAYNHAGLVEEGYRCFTSMKKYNIVPSVDHYGIMVDLFGRAGWLREALELIRSMPMRPHAGVWGALLLACRLHNDVELGEIAAQHCLELETDTTGYCSLLSNIYASGERWDDVKKLRTVIKKAFSKIPGCSWMEST